MSKVGTEGDLSMEVLHISAGNLDGGAARGAFWLHKGLLDLGLGSTLLLSDHRGTNEPRVYAYNQSSTARLKNYYNFQKDFFPVRAYWNRKNRIFSTALAGYDVTKHPFFSSADIIHLHWINNGFINFKYLAKTEKPVVWTIRDMWPFTGGCHYSMDCTRYLNGCGRCPQLGSRSLKDLSYYVVRRKLKYLPESMHLVAISDWIADCAKSSFVLGESRLTKISNCINTEQFSPIDRTVARKALGLNLGTQIILLGANSITDFYKGFDLALLALDELSGSRTEVLTFGKLDSADRDKIPLPTTSLGYVARDDLLRLAYSAADVFLVPSRMEAFGKTLVEALACGTPVVCFDATGPGEIVKHKVTGYKANPFDADDLAEGIRWVLEKRHESTLSSAARADAIHRFDKIKIASKYSRLYHKLLAGAES